MLRNGTDKCSCPYTDCSRNGKCDECVAYHNGKTRCWKDGKAQDSKDSSRQNAEEKRNRYF